MCNSGFLPVFNSDFHSCPAPCHAANRKKSGISRLRQNDRPVQDRPLNSTPANRVLLLGRIQELAMYRAEVLRARGFEVRTSTDKAEALRLIHSADFDAVVLSYTLSSDTVEELAEQMREHCPHCPLVVIAKTKHPDRKIAPDAIALADDGPKALLAALRKVLQRH